MLQQGTMALAINRPARAGGLLRFALLALAAGSTDVGIVMTD
jgi:hypothetical protein